MSRLLRHSTLMLLVFASSSPAIAAAACPTTSRFSVTGVLSGAVGSKQTYHGSITIRTPETWKNRHSTAVPPSGRFTTVPSNGCTITVIVGARGVATGKSASSQALASTTRPGAPAPFGSGRRTGGAWAVGYEPGKAVRGRAVVRTAKRRYLQILADAMLSSTCSEADARAVAPGIRTLVRTADTSHLQLGHRSGKHHHSTTRSK